MIIRTVMFLLLLACSTLVAQETVITIEISDHEYGKNNRTKAIAKVLWDCGDDGTKYDMGWMACTNYAGGDRYWLYSVTERQLGQGKWTEAKFTNKLEKLVAKFDLVFHYDKTVWAVMKEKGGGWPVVPPPEE